VNRFPFISLYVVVRHEEMFDLRDEIGTFGGRLEALRLGSEAVR
jgi:hypothetical protein